VTLIQRSTEVCPICLWSLLCDTGKGSMVCTACDVIYPTGLIAQITLSTRDKQSQPNGRY